MSKTLNLSNTSAMLFVFGLIILTFLMIRPAHADFSKDTHQVPPTATMTATKDANGNVMIIWTDPLKVTKVQHYIGHGRKGGFIKDIQVGAEKKVVLADIAKNGGRFNVVTENGKFLHLECGGNTETVMPKFVGMKVDCSYHGKDGNGPAEGALVVE